MIKIGTFLYYLDKVTINHEKLTGQKTLVLKRKESKQDLIFVSEKFKQSSKLEKK